MPFIVGESQRSGVCVRACVRACVRVDSLSLSLQMHLTSSDLQMFIDTCIVHIVM